jgi:hypothetical protein
MLFRRHYSVLRSRWCLLASASEEKKTRSTTFDRLTRSIDPSLRVTRVEECECTCAWCSRLRTGTFDKYTYIVLFYL